MQGSRLLPLLLHAKISRSLAPVELQSGQLRVPGRASVASGLVLCLHEVNLTTVEPCPIWCTPFFSRLQVTCRRLLPPILEGSSFTLRYLAQRNIE